MATGSAGLNSWREKILRDVARRKIARERYPANVRLLVFVVLGAMLWYYAHIEPLLRGTTLLGTPLTIWALWRFAQSWLPEKNRWSDDANETSRRVLAQPYARECLCVAAGLVAILLLTTSSVYLSYDEDQGSGDYEVEIHDGDNLLMAPQKVTSYKSLRGRAYFFNVTPLFRPWQLTLEITQPPYQFGAKPLTVRFPWSYRVKVPAAFPSKTYRVFRLLPKGDKWMNLSARKDDAMDTRFRLVGLLELKNGGDVELFQAPYFFEPVYFGGSREMIKFFQNAERESGDQRWNIVGHLKKKYGSDDVGKKTFETKADLLMGSETIRETIRVDQGSTLVIRVLKQDLATKEWELSEEFKYAVDAAGGIQNIYIE